MKKVNSMKKKVISTGLAISMLVSSVGVSQCFADDGKSLPENAQVNEGPTLPSLENVNLNDCKENTQVKEDISFSEVNLSDCKKNTQENEAPLFPKVNLSDGNDSNQITTPNLDKVLESVKRKDQRNTKIKKFAKTTAKVVAVAALTGAVAYTSYKYKDELTDIAKKSANYVSTHMNTAWKATKSAAKTAKTSIANGASNAWVKVKTTGTSILNKAKKSANYVSTNRKTAWKTIKSAAKTVKTSIANEASKAGVKIKTTGISILNKAKKLFNTKSVLKPSMEKKLAEEIF